MTKTILPCPQRLRHTQREPILIRLSSFDTFGGVIKVHNPNNRGCLFFQKGALPILPTRNAVGPVPRSVQSCPGSASFFDASSRTDDIDPDQNKTICSNVTCLPPGPFFVIPICSNHCRTRLKIRIYTLGANKGPKSVHCSGYRTFPKMRI